MSAHFMEMEEMVDINAKLIKIVEEIPQLYNHENISAEIKHLYWSKVTTQLKEEPNPSKDEVSQVRQRWKNLRDSYVKDFKLTQLQKQHNLKLRRGWRYAKQMTFLNPYISSRKPLKRLAEIERKTAMEEVDSETSQSGSEKGDLVQGDSIFKWMKPYPELTLKSGAIFCTVCLKNINTDTKYKVINHMRTAQHLARKLELEKERREEDSEPNSSTSRVDFDQNLSEFVVFNESNQLPSTSDAQPGLNENDSMLIENIKEEYDDTFEETVEEILPVTKAELMDIISEPQLSSGAELALDTVFPKEESISADLDVPSISEPPSKKSRLETLPVNGDKPGTSNQLKDPSQEFFDRINIHLAKKIQDDPSMAGMIDSSGNVDLFFESMLNLAKTLSPLDQVLLQRNIADVVFSMKVTQLTKQKIATSHASD